ncbi:hypothetical protein J4447_01075 [Candidatus Pacearchaeota archaeon]|nr:hypothetical protein [Candidatus Pacearchaeota archaeon]
MVSVTLAIPEEVKTKMDRFSEINWSGFIRKSIIQKTEELVWKEELLKQLKTDRDFEDWAVEMGRKVNKGIAEKLRKKGLL